MTETESKLITYEGGPRPLQVRVEGPAGSLGPVAGPEKRPAVLVLHGFKGFMHWGFFPHLSRRLAQAGYVCVSFNFSGSGIGDDHETVADPRAFELDTTSKQLEDVAVLRGGIARCELPVFGGIDSGRMAILGHSRGGGHALLHAAERGDYRAVVTWAAIHTVEFFPSEAIALWDQVGYLRIENARTGEVFKLDRAALDDGRDNRGRFDILAACARLDAPVLVVHAEDDLSVDASAATQIYSALSAGRDQLLRLDEGGHTFGATHPLEGEPEPLGEAIEATLRHLAVALA